MSTRMKCCLIIPLFAVFMAAAGSWAADLELNLDPSMIQIGTFYNGSTVTATGTVPAGSEAVVRVSGKPQEIHLKKKGKAGGILWMNIGDLTFDNAPRIYMLYTAETGKQYLADKSLDFSMPALQNRIEILPEGEDKPFFFNEFLKLKKKESVYAEYPQAVTYGAEQDGRRSFTVILQVPPRMSEDDYSVDLFAVQDGRVIGSTGETLRVEMISFPKKLAQLAFEKSLLYGVLSVLIAVAAGLFMGVVFGGKGGAH
ncbi:MAG: hypothetical protein Kow0089_03010 [Desulfobulbaceae bacterium]